MRVQARILPMSVERAVNCEGTVQPSFNNFETFLLAGSEPPRIPVRGSLVEEPDILIVSVVPSILPLLLGLPFY